MDHAGQPADSEPTSAAAQEVELTGHEAVDGVLHSLDGLADKPVGDHVAVFEQAHETLRAALTDAATRPDGPAGA